jgi:tetratricopeptide (TPR) repeat protein
MIGTGCRCRILVALRFFSLVFITAALVACSSDPNVLKQKYLRSGQHYIDQGKYREAVIQLLNAVKVDPGFVDAHYTLAQAYLKIKDWQRAYQQLERTIELQPDNYKARADLAKLLIVDGSLQQAEEQVDLLLAQRPDDAKSHFVAANLLAAQMKFPAAIKELEEALARDPGDWDLYLNLALMQMKTNQPNPAESNFKKAINLNPKAMDARLMLATYYQSRGRLDAAEQELRSAMEMDVKNPDPRSALARLYVDEGKKAEAEKFARQAKGEFPDNSAGYRMLGDFYFLTGDRDKATAEYADLHREHPKDLQVQKNYIELLLLENHLQDASKFDDELLSAEPNDEDALLYRGQLQIRMGQAGGAVETLQSVIRADPRNAVAHYHLGVAFQGVGNLDAAESEWREAVRLRPELLEAQRALALLAMRKGDMATLEQSATQMVKLQPRSPEGYALRAIANTTQRHFVLAESDARQAIAVDPQSALGYVQLGLLQAAQRQYGDAARSYREALLLNPDSTDAMRGLLNTYTAEKHVDQAIAAAKDQIEKSPRNPAFYDLLGSALVKNNDIEGAEAAFAKVLELDASNMDALLRLARIQALHGETDKAIALLENSLKEHPGHPGVYAELGQVYSLKQDWKRAEEADQNALALKPEDPVASYNLAQVKLQEGENLDVALALAQTARRALPDSSDVASTLGWIYYRKAAYKSAVSLLEEAWQLRQKHKLPDTAEIHYRLCLAYEKANRPVLARQELDHLLKLDPKYPGANDLKKELAPSARAS